MQKSYFGYDSIKKLEAILKSHRPTCILIVAGKKSYESCSAKTEIDKILKGYKSFLFQDFSPNPKIEDIGKGIEYFRKNSCDFIVAVGGGSVIDVAKSIRVLAAADGIYGDYIRGTAKLEKSGSTLVAIPTTAGTGSESTQFAVVYIEKEKFSLDSPLVLPDYAIIDPGFTLNLTKDITASTGMDALCQAVESYWSVNSTVESRQYAGEAIEIIMKNLEKDVNNPGRKTREAVAKASNLSGRAINISRTTACHAISYPITAYFGVPHGHACALTLPSMIVYNSVARELDINEKRGMAFLKKTMENLIRILGAKNPHEAKTRVENLMTSIGLETRLSRLGIDEKGIEIIIKNGFNPSRVRNNPRILTEDALRKMLEELM